MSLRYVIEMRIPVVVETDLLEDLAQARSELREKVIEHGWEPRFVTVEEWRYWGQFQAPLPFRGVQARPEAEHTGKLKSPRERRTLQ